MTMFYDDEIDRLFKSLSRSMNLDEAFEGKSTGNSCCGPICYGYTMTIGPDGRPAVKEFGNPSPKLDSDAREPIVDSIVDEKEKVVKLIAEMPGVEKSDVKVVVDDKTVNLDAERGDKKYHAKVPIQHRIEENSAKASYKNGILELVFKLKDPEKPKGKTVEVE